MFSTCNSMSVNATFWIETYVSSSNSSIRSGFINKKVTFILGNLLLKKIALKGYMSTTFPFLILLKLTS